MSPSPDLSADPFDTVLLRYLEDREAGSPVDLRALCGSHPELADRLRDYIASEQRLCEMAKPSIAEASASGDTSRIVQRRTETQFDETRTDRLPPPPQEFGRYQLLRKLGEGAMGSVYLARDTKLDRHVALKFPRHCLDSDGDGSKCAFAPYKADKLYWLSTAERNVKSLPTGGEIRSLKLGSDGRLLLIGRQKKSIDFVDVAARRVVKQLPLPAAPNAMSISPTGNLLAVALASKRCAVWDLETLEMSQQPVLLAGAPLDIQYNPSASQLAVKLQTGGVSLLSDALTPVADIPQASCCAWIDDQTLCYYHSGTGELQTIASGKPKAADPLGAAEHPITALTYVAARRRLIAADTEGEITAWTLDGQSTPVGRLPRAIVHRLFHSDDGRYLLVRASRRRKGDSGSCCTLFDLGAVK